MKFRWVGMHRWKRDRKHGLRIIILMILCFFLMEFTYLVSDSLEITMLERRKDAYGDWQYAYLHINESESEHVKANPFLAQAGTLWSAARVLQEDGESIYAVGGGDETAVTMARLRLMEGRLPEKAGEAAIEATTLRKLGIVWEIGDTITLNLIPAAGDTDDKTEVRQIEVTLCGVLKDYTPNWCISGRILLPSIFVTEDTMADFPGDIQRTLMLNGIPEWKTMKDDLNNDENVTARLYDNEYTWPEGAKDIVGNAMDVTRLTGGFLAAVVLAVIVSSSVKHREEEWRQLSLLGAERGQLRRMLVTECLIFGIFAMVTGLGLALLLFGIWIPIFSGWMGFEVHYGFSLLHLGMAAAIGAGIIGISYVVPCLTIHRYTYLNQKKVKKRRIRRKGKSFHTISLHTLLIRQWTGRPLTWITQWAILVGILVIPCMGLRLLSEQKTYLDSQLKLYGDDYALDGYNYSNNAAAARGIIKEKAADLLEIHGIAGMEAYQITMADKDFFTADLSAYESGTYYQMNLSDMERTMYDRDWNAHPEKYMTEQGSLEVPYDERSFPVDASAAPVEIWTVGETEVERFLRNLDENQVDMEAFLRGEEMILIVPPFTGDEYEDGWKYLPSINLDNQERDVRKGSQIYHEELVQIGDIITVSYYNLSSSELKVTGILRGMENSDCIAPNPYNAYTILTGEGFWNTFSEWSSASRYQFVNFLASVDAGESTDRQMTKGVTGVSAMEYLNNREIVEGMRQELYLSFGQISITSGMTILLLAIILYGILQSDMKYQKDKLRIWQDMGMKAGWIRAMYLIPAAITALTAIGTATFVLSTYYTYQTNLMLAESGYQLKFSILRIGFDKQVYAICCIIHFLFAMCMTCLPLWRKEVKEYESDE